MIDFDELHRTASPELLESVCNAMLNGADAKTVKAMFAEEGIELSEVDIAKVTPGIVRDLSKDKSWQELSLDDLDQAAGGADPWRWRDNCAHAATAAAMAGGGCATATPSAPNIAQTPTRTCSGSSGE